MPIQVYYADDYHYWNNPALEELIPEQGKLIGVAIRLMSVPGSTIHYYRVYAHIEVVMPLDGSIELYRKVLDDHQEEYVAFKCATNWAKRYGTRVVYI